MLRPSTQYGDEARDESVSSASDRHEVSHTVALFNLSATPERENHGAFLDHFAAAGRGKFSVMIDESGYLERVGSQPGGKTRMNERIALWRQFCELHNVACAVVNLMSPHTRIEDIEHGLVPSARAI